MKWRKARLNESQILIGLEAAYEANVAFDEIEATQDMIDGWQTPAQAAVTSEDRIRQEVNDYTQERASWEARFAAFDLVTGALIGRSAPGREDYPKLKIENHPSLTGEGMVNTETGQPVVLRQPAEVR